MAAKQDHGGCSICVTVTGLVGLCWVGYRAADDAQVFAASKLSWAAFEQFPFGFRLVWYALYAFATYLPVLEAAALACWTGRRRWASAWRLMASALAVALLDQWIADATIGFVDAQYQFPVPVGQWKWIERCAVVHWLIYATLSGLLLSGIFATAVACGAFFFVIQLMDVLI